VPASQPDQVHELFQAAFNARDTAAVLALYEETALFVTGPGPTVVTGREAIGDVLQSFFAMKPVMRLETASVLQNNDLAMLEGRWVLMGAAPFRFGFSASSRMSSRIPAIRELLSGPWQRKHVSAIIGRMSRLNRTCAFPAAANRAAAAKTRLRCIVASIYTRGPRADCSGCPTGLYPGRRSRKATYRRAGAGRPRARFQ